MRLRMRYWINRESLWPLVIITTTGLLCYVSLAEISTPIRPVLAFWFLLFCPGLAFIPLLRLQHPITEWTLIIALSVALDALVAIVMLYQGWWSPNRGLLVLACLALIGAVLQLLSSHRAEPVLGREPAEVIR